MHLTIVNFAVVKGSTKELMNTKLQSTSILSNLLMDYLHSRKDTAYTTFTTLHDFIYNLTSKEKDPVLPYLVRVSCIES